MAQVNHFRYAMISRLAMSGDDEFTNDANQGSWEHLNQFPWQTATAQASPEATSAFSDSSMHFSPSDDIAWESPGDIMPHSHGTTSPSLAYSMSQAAFAPISQATSYPLDHVSHAFIFGQSAPESTAATYVAPESNLSSNSPGIGELDIDVLRTFHASPSGSAKARRPTRQGPLTKAQRDKTDTVRDIGACWRCRRYKKSCDGPGTCTSCINSGYRIWPDVIGCRRGSLDDLSATVMPAISATVLSRIPVPFKRQPAWRPRMDLMGIRDLPNESQIGMYWIELSNKAQATRMFGDELRQLIEIVARYQQRQPIESFCISSACILLDSVCDFFLTFVESDQNPSESDISVIVDRIQKSMSKFWRNYLNACLVGKREKWFQCFSGLCIVVCSIVLLMDAVSMVPEAERIALWNDLPEICKDLRARLYTIIIELLNISARGSKPLSMDCWTIETTFNHEGEEGHIRNAKGMELVNEEEAAFDGFQELQAWFQRHRDLISLGRIMFGKAPYTDNRLPLISGLSRLFDI